PPGRGAPGPSRRTGSQAHCRADPQELRGRPGYRGHRGAEPHHPGGRTVESTVSPDQGLELSTGRRSPVRPGGIRTTGQRCPTSPQEPGASQGCPPGALVALLEQGGPGPGRTEPGAPRQAADPEIPRSDPGAVNDELSALASFSRQPADPAIHR